VQRRGDDGVIFGRLEGGDEEDREEEEGRGRERKLRVGLVRLCRLARIDSKVLSPFLDDEE
jgi:hypothetical protein